MNLQDHLEFVSLVEPEIHEFEKRFDNTSEFVDVLKYLQSSDGKFLLNDEGKLTLKKLRGDGTEEDEFNEFINDEEKLSHHTAARYFLNKYRFVTFQDNEDMFFYDGGIYHEDGHAIIKSKLEDFIPDTVNKSFKAEVIDHVKSSTFMKRADFQTDKKYIIISNGIFDLETKELIEFTPDVLSMNKLPIKYDQNADCPKIKKFLSEILSEDDIPIIQEMFGYCLYRDYPIHKAIMLLGSGANGKSTLINLLTTFLGEENISTQPLQALDRDKFSVALLYGKLANLYADVPDNALYETGKFKLLSGNDLVPAEKKFGGQFVFRNYAKMMFSANKLPEARDDSEGFFRRWIIINFPNKFKTEDGTAIPNLLETLTEEKELSGLFNWALKGLERLLLQKGFSYSKSTEEIQEDYQRKSNSLRAFCLDHVEKEVEDKIGKDLFYRYYVQYCVHHNIPVLDKRKVGMELQKYIPYVTQARTGQERLWKGLKLSNMEEFVDKDDEKLVTQVTDGDTVGISNNLKDISTMHLSVTNVTKNIDKITDFIGEKSKKIIDIQTFCQEELKLSDKETDDLINKMEDKGLIYEWKFGEMKKL